MNIKKKISKFKNEDEERHFWAKHDSTEYIDYSKGKKAIFPNLKPSVKTISIRMPEALLDLIKVLANKSDIPYQSLVKIYLTERVSKELRIN